VDIIYTGLVVTRDISPTISGWLLVVTVTWVCWTLAANLAVVAKCGPTTDQHGLYKPRRLPLGLHRHC